MAHHSHELVAPLPERFDRKTFGSLPLAFLAAAVVGILGSLIGYFVSKEQFAYSWLFACTYFFTLCAGGLFWTILHHATDSEWSVVVRRQMENLGSLIPIFFLLFLPLILFCAPLLWTWWNLKVGDDPVYDAKHGFLNHGFFWFRYIV